MAMAQDSKTLYPMLEKPVAGDDPQLRRINEFDVRQGRFTGRIWWYRMDPGSVSIGDFTQLDQHRFLAIERDNNQGAAARIRRIYGVDLRKVGPDGVLTKSLALDPMNIADPAGISLPGRPSDIGLGNPFSFPYVTIEDVLPLDAERLLVVNDNNFPFSTGRNPGIPDDNDFIVVRTGSLKNLG